jgi:GntR family transcriptional regulator
MDSTPRKKPLYNQLVDLLREKIETLKPGDLLPSERELSETYGLSRTTVRLALKELETQGLINRRHGKGTYVSGISREVANPLGLYSFTEQTRSQGHEPLTKLLEFGTCPAPAPVAAQMDLRTGDDVIRFRRLRMVDGVPTMLELTYLPAAEFVSLSAEDILLRPLSDIMEREYHKGIRVAEEEFYAGTATAEESEMLVIPEGSPVLRLARTTYGEKNGVVEYTHSVARSEHFRYCVSHVRG